MHPGGLQRTRPEERAGPLVQTDGLDCSSLAVSHPCAWWNGERSSEGSGCTRAVHPVRGFEGVLSVRDPGCASERAPLANSTVHTWRCLGARTVRA